MRTLLLFSASFILSISSVNAQNVTIPDANFKTYLLGVSFLNTNSDSEIQLSEAAAYNNQLNCSGLNISDLTGIEAFTSLTALWCSDNPLTSVDLSNCTSLFSFTCGQSTLSSLTLNSAMKFLTCDQTELTSLDLSGCPDLEQLHCGWNSLTTLDLSNNHALTSLGCRDNDLTSLNLANGNNHNMTYFWADLNPNLTCIQVDDAYWSTTNWYNIDAQTDFSINCGSGIGCTVTIPDANFKAYLVGNSSINTNADSEIQCSEATAFSGDIYCPNLNISDLTGIEAFTSLTGLYCNGNQLTSLNTSANTDLIMLYTQNNLLTSLDLSGNIALTDLSCTVNNLTTLDLTSLTALEWLDCSVNLLTTLDISMNTSLDQLFCYSNNLTSLNLSNNTLLQDVSCAVNQITSLDLSNNLALLSINCADNELQQLDLSSNTAMTTVSCQLNQLTSLDLSGNPALLSLQCQNNALTALNIANGQNDNLMVLFSQANPDLTCIQVDDAAYSNTTWVNTNYQHDMTASYNEDCGLGISENNLVLKLYPNPVNNKLTIESKQSSWVSINNSTGQNIAKVHINNGINQLPVEHLAAGLYFVVDENGNQLKFIKE